MLVKVVAVGAAPLELLEHQVALAAAEHHVDSLVHGLLHDVVLVAAGRRVRNIGGRGGVGHARGGDDAG